MVNSRTPFHYGDDRTARGLEQVHAMVPPDRLHARTGLAHLPFNTLYQLAAETEAAMTAARRMVLIPDLVGCWTTGRPGVERTNASTTVHLVGRGARNELLCQLTADACALPVVAGPVEATAPGNILVQARAAGWITGDLDILRARTRDEQPLRRYEPGRAPAMS